MAQTQAAPAAVNSFALLLRKAEPAIQKALPRHVDMERFTRIALSCVNRTPKLLACSGASLIRCVMQAAQLGLEIGSPLGEAYLVPFKGEAVLVIGYGGLVELATRTGRVTSVEARPVHERDVFRYRYGTEQMLEHVQYIGEDDPGKTVAVYALARLKEGEPKFEVMSFADVERIRSMSRNADGDTWTLHWDQMAAKTAVRRLSKLLPKSAEMARAIALDMKAEAGESQDDAETGLDLAVGITPQAEQSEQGRTGAPARIAEKMRKQKPPANGGGRTSVVVKQPDGSEATIPPETIVEAEGSGDGADPVPPHTEEASPAPSADAVDDEAVPEEPFDRPAAIAECRAKIADHKWGEAATVAWKAKGKATLEALDDAELREMLGFVRGYDRAPAGS